MIELQNLFFEKIRASYAEQEVKKPFSNVSLRKQKGIPDTWKPWRRAQLKVFSTEKLRLNALTEGDTTVNEGEEMPGCN